MEEKKEKIKNIIINCVLWCILLVLYFIFIFLIDGVLGIGFSDQWNNIKKWFITHTNLKSHFLFED